MPTVFYPTTTSRAGVTVPAAWSGATLLALELTRGGSASGQADATVASLTATIVSRGWGDTTSSGLTVSPFTFNGLVFISNQINAVTIQRTTITGNVRAMESNAMANYGVAFAVWRLTAAGVLSILDDRNNSGTELGTSEAARAMSTPSGSSTLAWANGDRIAIVIGWNSTGGTSASGFTATGFYNGPTAAASGDTFVTFAETITEQAPPAGGDAVDPMGMSGFFGA